MLEAIMTTYEPPTRKHNTGQRAGTKAQTGKKKAIKAPKAHRAPPTLEDLIAAAKDYVDNHINGQGIEDNVKLQARCDKHTAMELRISEHPVHSLQDALAKLKFLRKLEWEEVADPDNMVVYEKMPFTVLDTVIAFLESKDPAPRPSAFDPHIEWIRQIQELWAQEAEAEREFEAARTGMRQEPSENSDIGKLIDKCDQLGEETVNLGYRLIRTPAKTLEGAKAQADYLFNLFRMDRASGPLEDPDAPEYLFGLIRSLRTLRC